MPKQLRIYTLLLISFFPLSCGLLDGIEQEISMLREQSILALNDGIAAIENGTADFQSVLFDLEESIDQRIQETLTYDIPFIINIMSQRLLSSALCIKESAKDEVLHYLKAAYAELVENELPPLQATKICLTSHSTLDLNGPRRNREQIIYTGYLIHTPDSINARFINTSNGNEKIIPFEKIGFPDISNITVSLNDFSDDEIGNYTHVYLLYNKQPISKIAIIKKRPQVPIIETVLTNKESIVWIPPHTRGDRDFKGHGPIMKSSFQLKLNDSKTRVLARVYLSAKETKSDWTTSAGWSGWIELYNVKPGFQINRILDPTYYSGILKNSKGEDYKDTSHRDHIIETNVGRATLVGDTDGKEAGDRTKITLAVKKFRIEIQKR